MTDNICRIAMWSGPRNISTAMMRAFENRADCAVVDEPLYGFYLQATGSDHPGKDDIIQAMDCHWPSVVDDLVTKTPEPCQVFYQKHMSHHILPEVDLSFIHSLKNCFLIRDSANMIVSYAKVRPEFSLEELGLPQQLAIFRYCQQYVDEKPIVLDSAQVLAEPEAALTQLCQALAIPFSSKMLSWPRGARDSDGVWAKYWYSAVEASTGFVVGGPSAVQVPPKYLDIYQQAQDIYLEMLGQ